MRWSRFLTMATSTYRDGDPDLRLDGVLRRAEEGLDPQMLLDPLEEEFHLPAAAIEFGHGQRRQREVVGEKDEGLGRLGILETNAAQRRLELLTGVEAGQEDGLIADHPRRAIDGMGVPDGGP